MRQHGSCDSCWRWLLRKEAKSTNQPIGDDCFLVFSCVLYCKANECSPVAQCGTAAVTACDSRLRSRRPTCGTVVFAALCGVQENKQTKSGSSASSLMWGLWSCDRCRVFEENRTSVFVSQFICVEIRSVRRLRRNNEWRSESEVAEAPPHLAFCTFSPVEERPTKWRNLQKSWFIPPKMNNLIVKITPWFQSRLFDLAQSFGIL